MSWVKTASYSKTFRFDRLMYDIERYQNKWQHDWHPVFIMPWDYARGMLHLTLCKNCQLPGTPGSNLIYIKQYKNKQSQLFLVRQIHKVWKQRLTLTQISKSFRLRAVGTYFLIYEIGNSHDRLPVYR